MQLPKSKPYLHKIKCGGKFSEAFSFGGMLWVYIITFLFLLLYTVLIRFYHRHFKALHLFSTTGEQPQTPVSIIVAARNEAANMPALKKALESQSNPPHLYEIILVDDHSDDDTYAQMQTFSKAHAHVMRPHAGAAQSSKKRALEAGIAKAKNNLLLITDADCVPGENWLATMAVFQQKTGAQFLAAPVRFAYDNSLLQQFQALDFLMLQGITAAGIHARFHYMCNGANLAYTKNVFEKVGGFSGIDHVATGDDLLLMHKVQKGFPGSIAFVKSKAAIVTTQPQPTWRSLLMQRRRWASKTRHYTDKKLLLVLLFVLLFNLWFLVLLIVSFSKPHALILALLFIVFKALIELPFMRSITHFFGDEKLLRRFFFLQPLHILFTIAIAFWSQMGQYEWKGRKTK